MTKEQAIKIIRRYECNSEHYEACEIAIKALEQSSYNSIKTELKPCEDAISRRAVLDAIDVKAWEFCDYLISKNRNDEQKPVSHFADNLRECVREELPSVNPQPSGDLISREGTLTAFADYVGSGMSMNDYDALWDIVAKMPTVKQEPKFIAKSDGTIEQIKNCDDCLFKKEWKKIGKLISVVLEKQTEQEPSYNSIKTELKPCDDAISRTEVIKSIDEREDVNGKVDAESVRTDIALIPPVNPQNCDTCEIGNPCLYCRHEFEERSGEE